MADKYGLDLVKKEIVRRVSSDWPRNLQQWDLSDIRSESYEDSCHRKIWPEDLVPEPVSAAILVEEAGVRGVLTAVFYDMYRAVRSIDWDKDGSECLSYSFKGARWSLATTEHLHNLVLIQDVVDRTLQEYIPYVFIDKKGGRGHERVDCETAHRCRRLLNNKRKEVATKLRETRDPLAVLRRLCQWSKKSGLCESCRKAVFDRSTNMRGSIWCRIEEMFRPSIIEIIRNRFCDLGVSVVL